jgi:hypothetical protein
MPISTLLGVTLVHQVRLLAFCLWVLVDQRPRKAGAIPAGAAE